MNPSATALTDSFGRIHNYLRISLTERCNLRCSYCMPVEGVKLTPKNDLMTADEIFEIAKVFVSLGVNKIRLTGGEPLVRKDIEEIVKRLSTLHTELSITTNGILIDRFIPLLQETGIRNINVSLDTLSDEKYALIARRNYFSVVYENIFRLLNVGFRVKVNVVLIKGFNDNEINDFIDLTKDKHLRVRFIEFMPFALNRWDKSKLVGLDEIMSIVHTRHAASDIIRIEDKPNDTAKNYKIRTSKGTFAIISSVTNPFCDGCNRIRLTADGKLKNCLFSSAETPLLPALREKKSILPHIIEGIASKKAIRGGMDTLSKIENPALFNQNRSMITIGG